jgi:LysM repeat protein
MMSPANDNEQRCPQCDSRLPAGAGRCLMCGFVLPEPPAAQAGAAAPISQEAPGPEPYPSAGPPTPAPEPLPAPREDMVAAAARSALPPSGPLLPEGVVESVVHERQSKIVFWMTAVVFVVTAFIGGTILQYGGPVELALLPTVTPIPPTPSFTPTVTLPPTETPPPSATPEPTGTPVATPTLQPPRTHTVTEGETLFGLSFAYNVSMNSIAESNGFSVESPIQSGQTLQVPWPTATPPLEPISIEINGETVIADPRDCRRVEIAAGDALSVIAARENINMELLMRVNRLSEQSIVQPGDTICIPEVIHGDVLPPTPGPSPTPLPTGFPVGPRPLFPPSGTVVDPAKPLALQWVAIKDLEPDEWYMVEMVDITEVGVHPHRGFTRQTSFRVPSSWRPQQEVVHDFEWRISVVRVTGQRADGSLIYTFGGRAGDAARLSWLGAIPTPTPTATPTAAPAG